MKPRFLFLLFKWLVGTFLHVKHRTREIINIYKVVIKPNNKNNFEYILRAAWCRGYYAKLIETHIIRRFVIRPESQSVYNYIWRQFGHYKISLQLCLRRVQVLFTVSRPAGQGLPHTAAAGATAVACIVCIYDVVLSDHLAPRELD